MSATDDALFETMLRVENKDIFVDLKKNKGGVYLKISERNGSGRNTVLIPASGIPRLKGVLDDVLKISSKSKTVSRERKQRVAGDPEIVSRSVYVTGLSWDTVDEELAEYFKQAGEVVNAVVLRQRRGGSSRSSMGCGVVEMVTVEAAQHAVATLNETEFKGRSIRCREDRSPGDEQEDDGEISGGGGGGEVVAGPSTLNARPPTRRPSQGKVPEPKKVFVTSLTWDTTESDMIAHFGQVGPVVSAEILSTKKGRSMGSGIVEFHDETSVALAVTQFSGQDFKGRTIAVRQYFQ